MPVLRIYPSAVVRGTGFTTAQLANVLGNTAGYAVNTQTLAMYAGIDGTFTFPFSSLPANMTAITNIEASVVANANYNSARQCYSFECYNGSTILFKYDGVNRNTANFLTSTDSTFTSSGYTVGSFNSNVALWRNDSIEVNFTFIAPYDTSGTSVTTNWDKFWLDITYTAPTATGPDLLYMGENF